MIDVAKMNEVMASEETKKALANCKTNEEIQAYLNGKGIEITAEEVEAIMPKAEETMNLDDMEAVAGGAYGFEYFDKFVDAWNGFIHPKTKKDTDVMGTQQQADGSTLSLLRNGTMRLEKTLEDGSTLWQTLDASGKPTSGIGVSIDRDGMHMDMMSF